MFERRNDKSFRRSATRVLAVAGLVMIIWQPAEATAQGFFERLFGGVQRPSVSQSPSPQSMAYANPADLAPKAPTQQLPVASSVSFCVRLCDGRFFPIPALNSATPVQQCNSLCPASPTKIFSGSAIGHAVAKDGSRYAALENAFVFRQRLIPACTCNGKDHFGVARVDISKDPTRRSGDIVAIDADRRAFTRSGLRHRKRI